ncbi:MAG TPA: CHAD domain-containing protein, partial [Vicinamibacterales bacterium]|nr:CHAD domain-containing protein [Vicinamibacterales bacterium]
LTVRLRKPVSFAWDLPGGPLQEELERVIGVRRLFAQADVEQYGSRLEILDYRGKTVARLRIESGRARLPRSRSPWHPLPTAITLSGMRGYEDVYERLVPVIESRPGVEPSSESLHVAILRQIGASLRGDVSSPRVDLAPTVRGDVGARRIHLALLGILLANEPGLRANLDTEFLHDFRIAVRRTRSLLGQIKHVFPPAVVEHFSTEFSWTGRLTGPPRDMDVLVLALRERGGEVPASDMESLTAFLDQVQQQEHRDLVDALDSSRYRRLLADWGAFLERPAPSEPLPRNAGRRLAEVVSRRAWRLSERIARSAGTIDERTPAARLHEVRIDTKKLRYLIDVTPAFYDAAHLDNVLRALKKLQRVLGDFNDTRVQERRLLECGRAMSAAGAPSGALQALGRLAEQSRQRSRRLRSQVIEGLSRFGARDTRSVCRRAFKGAAPAGRGR